MDYTAKPKLKGLSLFTGYGGLDRGIKRAIPEYETIAYVEIESICAFNLAKAVEANTMDKGPIWTNVATFDARKFRGCVDVITGGFPCQPFSVAGSANGTEDPRHLFPHVERIAKETNAGMLFLENVPGLRSTLTMDYAPKFKEKIVSYLEGTRQRMGRKIATKLWERILNKFGRSALLYVVSRLEFLGYKVEWGIFSASEVGAPHQRKRLFILAIKQDCEQSGRSICLADPDSEHRSDKQVRGESTLSTTGSLETGEESGNPESILLQGREARQGEIQSRRTGNESEPKLGNPKHIGPPTSTKQGGTRKTIPNHESGKNAASEFEGTGETGKLANSSNKRLQGYSEYKKNDKKGWEESNGHTAKKSSNLWPARPGQNQYEWEEPRTITNQEFESSLGGSIDGYKFRTDLLRMLGNGVVEQTAELAFRTLIEKFK